MKFLCIKFPESILTTSDDFFSACTELDELSVYTRKVEFRMPNVAFPLLIKLSAYHAEFEAEFFEKNLQIEELEMSEMCCDSETIRSICWNLLNLRKLKLYTFSGSNLGDLSLLNRATIHLDGMHEDINRIYHLQNVTQITIHEWTSASFEPGLIEIAQNLRNLEKMKVKPSEMKLQVLQSNRYWSLQSN